ncbi:MAG: YggT family protein [Chloroflexi bacterium]|nr:YggT family protein [Chloroflexota bacterium]
MPSVDPVDRREEVRVVEEPAVERTQVYEEDVAASQRNTLYQLSAFIGLLFGILEGLIGIRILLKLIGANAANAFASFVYSITDLFLWPFAGLTATPAVGGMVLEISSIIAMIVYALIAWAVIQLLWVLLYHPSVRRVSTYERDRRIRY